MSWEEKELVHIIDFYNNQRVPLSGIERSKVQGIYPYHGAQGVVDHINKYIFDGKYILVAEDGENLRSRNQDIARFANGKFWVNNHAHIIRGKKGICDDYFLKVNLNLIDIGGYVTGAAQPKLSMTNLIRIKINLPPLKTQKRIADILSAYDDLIENNLKRIKLLEQAAQNIYKEWFVNLRFPGHENTPINEKTGLPVGWEYGVISDFGKVVTGKTPSTKRKDFYGTDVPFIKTPDMHMNIYMDDIEQYLSFNGAESQKNKYLPKNTVIVACIGARAGVVALTSKDSQTNQQINALVPSDSNAHLWFYFFFKGFKDELRALGSSGATMTNVSKGKFEGIKLNYPPAINLKELNKIATDCFNGILNLQKQNQKLKAARDILLPRLMNRTIEV